MSFKAGLANESFKLCYGHDAYRNDGEVYRTNTIRLTGARGLNPAFQIVVMADGPSLLLAGEEPAFSRRGQCDACRIEVECPFPATLSHIGMVTDDDQMERADILLSHPVAELQPGYPAAVYVSLDIPRDADPGCYPGRVRLWRSRGFSEESRICEMTFKTEVFSYTMPSPSDWRFKLDLWQHCSNIARKAEAPLWSERHFSALAPYVKSLAGLGQKCITIIASEIPWSGQSCFMEHRNPSDLYEYSMIRVSQDADGVYTADFSPMDQYIALCESSGFPQHSEIGIFGLVNIWRKDAYGFGNPAPEYPEAIRVRVKRPGGFYGYMCGKTEIDWYIREIERHCIETGIIDRVRVIADEPEDKERFRASLQNIRSLAPSFRFKAALNHAEFIEEFGEDIDCFAPGYKFMIKERETLARYRREMPDKDFLWYVCLKPAFPNTFIRSSLLEARAIGYITFSEGYDGFLRWNYTVWPQDPRKELRYPAFPCGDLNFVYPAGDMSPLLSLRYQSLKRGIEDFEMMSELAIRGFSDEADEILGEIILTGGRAQTVDNVGGLLCLEYEQYHRARRKMLKLLSGRGKD